MTRRTYLDTCVLRLAFGAKEDAVSKRALEEFNQHDTIFLYSRIVELETLPNPIRNRQTIEVEFYKGYFSSAVFVECNATAADIALADACKAGMAAADALHVGCAAVGGADELVTAEYVEKPMPKATAVKVRTIRYHDEQEA